jgi:hypothetical protein
VEFTIRNPHETVPLTEQVARALGVEVVADSSGLLAAVYELDGEEEAAEIRAKGFVVERVQRSDGRR